MLRAIFKDWIARTNTNGGVFYAPGEFPVRVDRIGEDAPQDWELGPKMKPGEFGAFREHLAHPRGHSPYAFATGKTAAKAAKQAINYFRERVSEWERINE